MLMPSDKDYQETKRIKQSGRPLASPFREIADWIASEYGVQVLNVLYDTVIPDDRPRLSVILEWDHDAEKFRDRLRNYDDSKQDRVLQQFKRLLVEQNIQGIVTEGMFVIFASFEAVARIEANDKVTKADLNRLKRTLANRDLWIIYLQFDSVTFFFYTVGQAQIYEANGLKEVYAEEYMRLVKQYDEFGYIAQKGIIVYFDSKENFDRNYKGSWFNYSR